jgi:hypothetical protein
MYCLDTFLINLFNSLSLFSILTVIYKRINRKKFAIHSRKNDKIETPKKIYISRRSWVHGDLSNIGTNYTTRRKMINEDELVDILVNKYFFTEIFAENLNTDEKIFIFSNSKIICGSIGGGMANLLFSNKNTKSIVLVTPFFLDINYRFKYSLENTDISYFNNIDVYKENNNIPLYCRAIITNEKSNYYNKYGEIIEYNNNKYLINISNNDIAGFNNNMKFNNYWFIESEFKLLDNGLNSPYKININIFINNFLKIYNI